MKIITQNPYRLIGAVANANQRVITKQKAKISAYQKVGKDISFPEDLPFIGEVHRTQSDIESAFAAIEMSNNKLLYALFWFVNHTPLDEMGLTYLQSGDVAKAKEIWEKATQGKSISSSNFTAFNNLGTLLMQQGCQSDKGHADELQAGLQLKIDLLLSDQLNDFAHLVADETYTADTDAELQRFVNATMEHSADCQLADQPNLTELLVQTHPKVKAILSEKLTAEPVYLIERKLEQVKKSRVENPSQGIVLGNELYAAAKEPLHHLSQTLGKSDLKYSMLADKTAKEILQCGVDYFKYTQENPHATAPDAQHAAYLPADREPKDVGTEVSALFQIAQSLGEGALVKDRIAENVTNLQNWIDSAPQREQQEKVKEELELVGNALKEFQTKQPSVFNVERLLQENKPRLNRMKEVLGAGDELYLRVSSAVAGQAMGMLVAAINSAQQRMIRSQLIAELKRKIEKAIQVSQEIGSLDAAPELRQHLHKNHKSLLGLHQQMGQVSRRAASSDGPGVGRIILWIVAIGFILMRACS